VGYLALLRLPGVARLAVASLLGRIPIVMVSLSYILLLRALGRPFALAGTVAGAVAVAAGIAAIPQGRLVDRFGQTRILIPFALANAAAVLGVLLTARAGGPAWALIALAALDGLTIPPLSASMRTLWPVLTGGEHVETAFALESVLQEGFYIAGPLLAGAIAALASPDAALVTAVVLTVGGTLLFATSRVSRARRGVRSSAGRLGALASPGLRTLIVALLPAGIAFGALEVALPAFAEAHGSRPTAGLLLALWGVGSIVGGLWYGRQRFTGPVERRLLIVLAVMPVAMAPVALAGSVPTMAVLIAVAGAPIAPAFTVSYTLIDRLASAGATTEAFTATTTAIVAGLAFGNAAGGALVGPIGTSLTFLLAAAVAALCPLAVLMRRRTLVAVTA
jgi:MFS family permease